MSWTDSLVFPLLDSTHLPNLFDFERFRCDRKKVWKQSHPPLTIDAFGNLASGDVKNYRQGRAQWWRCWCWHGQEGSVSWRCSWRCWDYSLTSCKDVKTKRQLIGEATTTYHDVKIQMQPCHLFMLIKNCDFLRLFVWTLGVTSYSWPPNRPEAGWWGRMVRWRAQWWWNRAGKERTNGASIIRWWIFLCHIAIQPNGSRMMAKTASLSKVIDFGHRSWTIWTYLIWTCKKWVGYPSWSVKIWPCLPV